MQQHDKTVAAVLMGGVSSEREVSLHSGAAVADALRRAGFGVVEALVDSADLSCLDGKEFDAVFIALHGAFGEDGAVQALLEEADIPYTGSPPQASRDAMDKVTTKAAFAAADVPTPDWELFDAPPGPAECDRLVARFGGRVVVKPSAQGSSLGVSIVGRDGLERALEDALSYDGRAVVEPYVAGRELTVGVVGRTVLPVIELRPHHAFFDYEAKYTKGETDYIVGAELPEGVAEEAARLAVAAFDCLGCRDLARIDMILADDGELFVLEANTIPGFTETSLVPMAAAAVGKDFPRLCGEILGMALARRAPAAKH